MDTFQELLCHRVVVRKRTGESYEDGKSIPIYTDGASVPVRISSLSFKDLRFMDKVQEKATLVYKMTTMPDAPISLHDTIVSDDLVYKVIYEYPVYGVRDVHHKKFYIKHVE